jgi:1-phosphatidylinositol-4-phosphate 5-kinase
VTDLQIKNQQLTATLTGIYGHLDQFMSTLNEQFGEYNKKMQQLKDKKLEAMREEKMIVQNYKSGGNKVFITDDLWKVVITIMAGIEMSVRAFDYEKKQYNNSDKDFSTKNTFEINHPSLEKYKVAQFIDYAPTVFNYLRKISGIFPEQYIESLGPEILSKIITGNMDTFEGVGSSGKSGSLFFTTPDKKYLVKTVSKEEFGLFMGILPHYYNHMCSNSHSLIAKIFSLHRIVLKSFNGKIEEWIIVVMQNIMCTSSTIHEKYDLKGSTYKRKTKGGATGNAPGKDLDLKKEGRAFNLSTAAFRQVISRLRSDTEFLASQNIIDYSLLVGVHERNTATDTIPASKPGTAAPSKNFNAGISRLGTGFSQGSFIGGFSDSSTDKEFYSLPTVDNKYILYFGIIDIFTPFNARKKAEFALKRTFLGSGISCIPPVSYSKRFMDFMQSDVFKSSEVVQQLESSPSLSQSPGLNSDSLK